MHITRRGALATAASIALIATLMPGSSAMAQVPGRNTDFSIGAWRAKHLAEVTAPAWSATTRKELLQQGLSVMKDASGHQAIVDSSLAGKGIIAAVNATSVSLSWDAVSPTAAYSVNRDGKPLTQLPAGATSFVDTAVVAESTHQYTVLPVGQAAGDPKARSWSMKATVPSVNGSGQGLTAWLAKRASVVRAAGVGATSTLSWDTFIPQARLDAPTIGGKAVCTYGTGYQFGGDNHGFDWRAAGVRTTLNAVVTWSNKSLQSFVSIGTTHVYRKSNGALVDRRTASVANSYIKKLGSGSNYIDIRMVTHARNPFCPSAAGAIDGAFSITLTQSGNYSIFSGNHRRMPNHYVYLFDQGVAREVYRLGYANPYCLFGAATCPLANFYGSGAF